MLIVGINIVLGTDLLIAESKKWATATLTGFVLLAAFIPLVTLAVVGDDVRSLFDGRYVIDEFALILKALFLLAAYVVVLISQTELEEGGYYQGEYYVLLLCSVLGMVMMTSSRDLVSVFIALELLSIPAYMLAAWRKRDRKSNEAGVKYYLLGVFASAVLLYGMSLLYGATGSTKLIDIGVRVAADELDRAGGRSPSCSSSPASPSRCRRCRSTRGRPTPTRARRRRSPRSCRWRRRRPASSP